VQPYYNYFDHSVLPPSGHLTYPAALDTLPLFLRGGSILPRRDIVRRAAPLHHRDPVTLVIALDATGKEASGTVYLDDGDSYAYERGEHVRRLFSISPVGGQLILRNVPESTTALAFKGDHQAVNVEAIIVLGLADRPTCIRRGQAALAFDWQPGVSATSAKRKGGVGKRASVLRIERASAPIATDWSVTFDFDASAACDTSSGSSLPLGAELQSPECPAGRFRCANAGHVPSCILISRVNDGLCDDDCCDGSDEFDGRCPNRCKAIGAAARAAADEEARKGRVGAKLRAEYASFGAKERVRLGAQVANLEMELKTKEADEKRLRAVLEQTEARAADDTERKKATPLYKRLVEHQAAIRTLRRQRTNLESHVADLTSMMSDLKGGYNPNNQDMAVKHAVLGFEEWQREHVQLEAIEAAPAGDTESSSSTATDTSSADDDVSDEALDAMESEDPLTLMERLTDDRVGVTAEGPTARACALHCVCRTCTDLRTVYRIEDYIPSTWRPAYDAGLDFLLDLLGQIGISSVRRRSSGASTDSSERPDIARARTAHAAAETTLAEGKRRLEQERGVLDRDWGRDWEWKKLDGVCVEKDTGECVWLLTFTLTCQS
jgi:alpha 1,3-glucosidase